MNDVPAYLAIVGLIHHAHRGGARNFPMGAESLMRGLTYSYKGTFDGKNFPEIHFHLLTGGSIFQQEL